MIHLDNGQSLVVSMLKGDARIASGLCGLVIRIDRTRHTHAVTTRLRPFSHAIANEPGFELVAGDVSARGALGRYRVTAPGVALELAQDTVATLFGDRGVMTYPGGVELGYYAYTQLAVTGVVDGARVTGTGWFEHQWGDARVGDYRWRYLAAQLDNGERIAAFAVTRGKDDISRWRGRTTYAIRIAPDGTARELPGASLVEFRLRAHDVDLRAEPLFAAQRCRTLLPMIPNFWEGACRVTGTVEGRAVSGLAIGEVVS